jgi:hypothetical protein
MADEVLIERMSWTQVREAMAQGKHTVILPLAAMEQHGPHMAIGTDTIHVHPEADGAVLGKATHLDLMKYVDHIARLEGGVYINLGSAVILPEVFLKALSAVRNMGYEALRFMTVNMDMQRHYRPSENVLRRPAITGAQAIHLTGQHEIMLPLLAAAIQVEQGRLK